MFYCLLAGYVSPTYRKRFGKPRTCLTMVYWSGGIDLPLWAPKETWDRTGLGSVGFVSGEVRDFALLKMDDLVF